MMTGKLVYRVDDNQVTLFDYSGWRAGKPRRRTGSKTADLEITIDLDALRAELIADALRNANCTVKRIRGAIVARPIKGTVCVHGDGQP